MNKNISYYKGGDALAIWAADVCSLAARQLICIEPTVLRLRHIEKQIHSVAQSNSAFTRAASLAQLVLALGPSPRPCSLAVHQTKSKS